jgi:lipopolysaccharide export system permease protein
VIALDRYLARQILAPFLAGLVFLTQILLATQFVSQADVLLGSGVSALDLCAVAADLAPHILGYVIPVSFLLGAVLGTGRLAEDRELIALGAAGISPATLARVPLGLSLLVAAIALWMGLVLEPLGLRDARQRVNDIIRKNVSSDVRAGVFYEDLPGLTLYAESTRGGSWSHVLISDRTDPVAPLLALAQRGRLDPAGEALRLSLERGEVHREELRADEYVSAHYQRATITLGISQTLSERNRLVGSLFERGPGEIVALARQAASRDPAEARRWRTFLHRRIAGPLAVIAFALLAMPIAMARRGGRAFGYAATILAAVAYYALLRFGEGLSQQGVLPAWLGPNLPNLVFAAGGAALTVLLARRGPGVAR